MRALAEVTGIDLERALRRPDRERRARLRLLGDARGAAAAPAGRERGHTRRRGPPHRRRPLHRRARARRAAGPGLVAGRRASGGRGAARSSWPSRRRRAPRRCSARRSTGGGSAGSGCCSGCAGVVGSVVLFAEASVFLWVPALAVGLLAGVLLAEATRPRPRWALASPAAPAAPGRADLAAGWSGRCGRPSPPSWSAAVARGGRGDLAGRRRLAIAARRPAGRRGCWPRWRCCGRWCARCPPRAPTCPVDEALRTWTAHLVTAAATRARAAPARRAAAARGDRPRDRVVRGRCDLLPVALVAGGFSALAAGLAVAGFLLTWLRPVRPDRARAGAAEPGRSAAPDADGRITLWAWSPGRGHRAARDTSHLRHVLSHRVSARPRSGWSTSSVSLAVHRCHSAPCSLSCRDRQPGWRPTRAASTGPEPPAPGRGCRPTPAATPVGRPLAARLVLLPGSCDPWKCCAPLAPAQPVRRGPAGTHRRHAGLLPRPEVRDAHRRRTGRARSAPTPTRWARCWTTRASSPPRTTSLLPGRRRRGRATATPSSSTAPARWSSPSTASRREVYVTALSVDEALDQLGYRADDLVLSASRSERLPLDGMELTITTPKEIIARRRRPAARRHHDRRHRRRPARRAGHRAEPDRPDQPLPGPGAAEPHAPAGLPGAGQRGRRDARPCPPRQVETPDPDAFVGERTVTTPGVDGEQVTTLPRHRHRRRRDRPRGHSTTAVTAPPVTEQVTVGTKPKPAAPRRPDRRRPQLGRAGQVRVRRQPPRGQPGRLLRASTSSR